MADPEVDAVGLLVDHRAGAVVDPRLHPVAADLPVGVQPHGPVGARVALDAEPTAPLVQAATRRAGTSRARSTVIARCPKSRHTPRPVKNESTAESSGPLAPTS